MNGFELGSLAISDGDRCAAGTADFRIAAGLRGYAGCKVESRLVTVRCSIKERQPFLRRPCSYSFCGDLTAFIRFCCEVRPNITSTFLFGTAKYSARTAQTSSLALPPSGAALTFTLRMPFVIRADTSPKRARGITFTSSTRLPSRRSLRRSSSASDDTLRWTPMVGQNLGRSKEDRRG
jgi:hypothetical protein